MEAAEHFDILQSQMDLNTQKLKSNLRTVTPSNLTTALNSDSNTIATHATAARATAAQATAARASAASATAAEC